jgi:hypothetical protein
MAHASPFGDRGEVSPKAIDAVRPERVTHGGRSLCQGMWSMPMSPRQRVPHGSSMKLANTLHDDTRAGPSYLEAGWSGIGVADVLTIRLVVMGTACCTICSRKQPPSATATRSATSDAGACESTRSVARTAEQWAATSPLRTLPDRCQSISTSQVALLYSTFRIGAYRASWASSHHPMANAA